MSQVNQADPRSIGRIEVKTEKVEISKKTTYTPKEIPTSFGKVLVNPDGTITVQFGTTQAKAIKASSVSTSDLPSSNITYELSIKKPDGTTELVSINPPEWTSPVFTA